MNKLKKALIVISVFVVLFLLSAGIFFLSYTPTVTFDLSQTTGDVTSGASGYLYGLAENGVPSMAMCESVDISSVSQKVVDGLQHPIGDIDHVYPMLDSTDYNVVYLQDSYDTWYYAHDEIMQMRADGTYDWQTFMTEDFFPRVKASVEKLSASSYADKVVYCLYNECDNGVWFGETRQTDDPYNQFGVWAEYNTAGRDAFNEAWKQTYDLVKSINPDAMIGGPGFCDYNSDELQYFLKFCVENNCVPEIMIYHELHDDSVYYWQDHVDDYRRIESELGLEELPIIVTEYGRMQDNGYPGKMVQYITKIEDSKVYANNAYWRLSNNLNDVCADDNSPNANWWLMRWYADMSGQTLASKSHDLFKSDFERSVRNKKSLDHQGFMGIASLDETNGKISVVCGGRDGEANIVFDNLKNSVFDGQLLKIRIEETVYKGLYGIVSSPVLLREYVVEQNGNKLKIPFNDLDEANAYHVTVEVVDENIVVADPDFRPLRFEFEHGQLLGNAYLYDSYCPTSGDLLGMVGGMENEGDGISLQITVPEDGLYYLDFVYGNSNDGPFNENGKQKPDDRKITSAKLSVDGVEEDIHFYNTIKSEYTSCHTVEKYLTSGEHTVAVMNNGGTYVLDSLVVTEKTDDASFSYLYDEDRSNSEVTSYLLVAPADGRYSLTISTSYTAFSLDGANGIVDSQGNADLYLRRGLNYIDFESADSKILSLEQYAGATERIELNPEDAVLTDAQLSSNEDGLHYIDGISSVGGSALYEFEVESAGDYRVTLLYANNDEGGVHDYNVDLIERYVTVNCNGQVQNVFCRNTYAWDCFKTVTFNVELKVGKNTIELTNSGEIRFDGKQSFAPYISDITINPVVQ